MRRELSTSFGISFGLINIWVSLVPINWLALEDEEREKIGRPLVGDELFGKPMNWERWV